MYKMVHISAKTWNKAGFSVIKIHRDDNVNKTPLKLFSISDIDKEIKVKYMVKNMSNLTKPQIRKYKTDKSKLIKSSKYSMYVYEDITITIIMESRLSVPKTIKYISDLGFNQINLILKKEQSVAIPLLKAFLQK